jgi:hypothetical protein
MSKNARKISVLAAAVIAFTCVSPAAYAQQTTQVCEPVKHCVQFDVLGVQFEACVTLIECRTVGDQSQTTP